MRSLIGTFALGVLLLLSVSCSKPNSNQPSDNTAQKVRGCITISSGLGSDISKCLDMTFQ